MTSKTVPKVVDGNLSDLLRQVMSPLQETLDELGIDMASTLGYVQNGNLRADVVRRGDKLIVTADLPGVKKEDIKIALTGVRKNVLTISAEKKANLESTNEIRAEEVLRQERSFGIYERQWEVPEGVKPNDIKANYQDGVLTLEIVIPQVQPGSDSVNIPIN